MCGRFTQTQSNLAIASAFQLSALPVLQPRYNIAPTQPIAIVRATPTQPREFGLVRWGLVPFWAKDLTIGARMINARSETVAEKPAFRAALRYRRCLILADGFYEWQKQDKHKQPFYIHLADHPLFAFAGLWESWQGSDGSKLETCTILTTSANTLMQPIHDRMPVILHAQDYDQWLDPTQQTAANLQPLLQPYPEHEMNAYSVSATVNKASSDRPECIQPLSAVEKKLPVG
jgi:putative SOS response-associated peptidase YedK